MSLCADIISCRRHLHAFTCANSCKRERGSHMHTHAYAIARMCTQLCICRCVQTSSRVMLQRGAQARRRWCWRKRTLRPLEPEMKPGRTVDTLKYPVHPHQKAFKKQNNRLPHAYRHTASRQQKPMVQNASQCLNSLAYKICFYV